MICTQPPHPSQLVTTTPNKSRDMKRPTFCESCSHVTCVCDAPAVPHTKKSCFPNLASAAEVGVNFRYLYSRKSVIAVIKLKTFDIELSVNENGLDGYEKPKRAHTANTMNIPDRKPSWT